MVHQNNSIEAAKKAAGHAGAMLVQSGMLIGLGTGSTAAFFIKALGRRCREEGLKIRAIATSQRSADQAREIGIPLEDEQNITMLDLTIDGADEIDPHKNMIKGGGGALFREKLLARSSQEMIVLVDETKLVSSLGAFPVPVEISSFLYRSTLSKLHDQGYSGTLRLNRDSSFYLTDNGNYIVDINIKKPIVDPETHHKKLRDITGVIETGLFFKIAGRVVIGYQDGFAKVET